jgi:hypothetical protein
VPPDVPVLRVKTVAPTVVVVPVRQTRRAAIDRVRGAV